MILGLDGTSPDWNHGSAITIREQDRDIARRAAAKPITAALIQEEPAAAPVLMSKKRKSQGLTVTGDNIDEEEDDAMPQRLEDASADNAAQNQQPEDLTGTKTERERVTDTQRKLTLQNVQVRKKSGSKPCSRQQPLKTHPQPVSAPRPRVRKKRRV